MSCAHPIHGGMRHTFSDSMLTVQYFVPVYLLGRGFVDPLPRYPPHTRALEGAALAGGHSDGARDIQRRVSNGVFRVVGSSFPIHEGDVSHCIFKSGYF